MKNKYEMIGKDVYLENMHHTEYELHVFDFVCVFEDETKRYPCHFRNEIDVEDFVVKYGD